MPSVAQAVLASWSFPPWATALNLFAAVLYLRGWMELHPALPGRFPAWRLAAFLSGLAALETALASPIDTFDPFLLTDHMVQHLFLMMIVPPLILLGNPYLALLRGMPRWAARRLLGPLLNWRPLGRFGRGLVHPAVGFLALALANFGWHLPAAYELALRSPGWHDCEHACFFAASLLYWWPVVRPWPSRGRSLSWFLPVYLALGDIVNSILSAFLALSGRVLYPWYAAVPRLGGLSAQGDQVAAGAVMWVIGSLAFLIPAVIITVRLLSPAGPAAHSERHGARPGPSRFRRIFLPALALILPLAALAFAWLAPDMIDTDGDIVRAQGVSGPFQITVFTAPGGFAAGPADASVLVQGRDSGEVILDAEVTLSIQPAGGGARQTIPADREHSTNKLLEAGTLNLAGEGPWNLRVSVRRGGEHGAISATFDAAPRPPPPNREPPRHPASGKDCGQEIPGVLKGGRRGRAVARRMGAERATEKVRIAGGVFVRKPLRKSARRFLAAAAAGALLVFAAVRAGAGPRGAASAAADEKGRVLGLAFDARVVSNLDRSVAFYEALGFTPLPGVSSAWRVDPVMNRLHGAVGAESRMAKLSIHSNISGKPFTLYLRQYRGIPQKNWSHLRVWNPPSSHMDLTVPDADALWARLKSAGMLWPLTWGGKLVALPGETKGSMGYITDPDGMDMEIVNQSAAQPAAGGRPARAANPPGLNHLGLVVVRSDQAKAFYGGLLGERFPNEPYRWLSGDFMDAAVGGHGNILRITYGTFPEAADPSARMRYEIIEYKNQGKTIAPFRMSDIAVNSIGLQVEGLDALLARLKAAGAPVYSAGGVVQLSDGTRAVVVRDPDTQGFIELFEAPRK